MPKNPILNLVRSIACLPVCRMSMDSVDSWTMSMDSEDSLDNVHGHSGQWPWIQWTLSMDSVDIVHGLSGQSGHYPWTPWIGLLTLVLLALWCRKPPIFNLVWSNISQFSFDWNFMKVADNLDRHKMSDLNRSMIRLFTLELHALECQKKNTYIFVCVMQSILYETCR